MRSSEHTKNDLLNEIVDIEDKLKSGKIDNFNVPKRLINSRKKTLNTHLLMDSDDVSLIRYRDKLKGKLEEKEHG